MNILRLAFCAAALPLLLAGNLEAQTQTYAVHLTGSQENPAVSTPGSATVTLVVDTATGVGSLTGQFQSLLGNRIASHIHGPAAIGSNGPVVVTVNGGSGTSGTLSANFPLSPTQLTSLASGLLYINLHTTSVPSGELRGQIVQRVNSFLPSANPGSDPTLLDIGGNTSAGPFINDPSEPFNLSIDCNGANIGGLYVVKVFTAALPIPINTKFGFIYVSGQNLASFSGLQQSLPVDLTPAGVTLPNDLAIVGLDFFAQGFCTGGLSTGRTTDAIHQVVGI